MKKVALAGLLLPLALATLVSSFDPVSIRESDYKMIGMTQSGRYVTWAWKVKLSNDVGTPQKVDLTVQLLDFSGYEVASDHKTTRLDMWETKTLTGQRRLSRDLWEKVTNANYKMDIR